jgi:hypothetical protein
MVDAATTAKMLDATLILLSVLPTPSATTSETSNPFHVSHGATSTRRCATAAIHDRVQLEERALIRKKDIG